MLDVQTHRGTKLRRPAVMAVGSDGLMNETEETDTVRIHDNWNSQLRYVRISVIVEGDSCNSFYIFPKNQVCLMRKKYSKTGGCSEGH
jgi:hypothetical protein